MSDTDFRSLTFDSSGTTCDGWFFAPRPGGPFERAAGHPAVVMAHGLGGTKDSGLAAFARALRDAGLAVLVFDYRGFGSSAGQPRQRISLAGQRDDYRAAVATAVREPGVDPDRIVLWGVSMSGGHVLRLAAELPMVCAVIALVPLVSGPAAARHALAQVGVRELLAASGTALRSSLAGRAGRAATMLPVVGRPGERAALTGPGHYESYLAVAGPTWRNEVDAALGVELANYRVAAYAARITVPVLVQIADFDRAAPPHAAAKVAFAARAEVRHYPGDHFTLFAEYFDAAVAHQLGVLRRQLAG